MSYDPILGGPRYSPSLQHSLMDRRHFIRVDVLDFILVSYFVDNFCGSFQGAEEVGKEPMIPNPILYIDDIPMKTQPRYLF